MIVFLSLALQWLGLSIVLAAPVTSIAQSATVSSKTCSECHAKIYEGYQRTGMARSFYVPQPSNDIENYATNTYFHAPSETYFAIVQKDGKRYQRRWQIGFDGKETNVEEATVDYVLGSGNHARTYLQRTDRGTLIQLPLGWYSEKGGYWGVNPGYDTPRPPAQRPIAYECMFCHNAYPQIPADHEKTGSEPVYTGELPQGIDCQRCHGSGAAHVRAARTQGANTAVIRAAIVNPKRLSKERQMEVCMQCHLETTSTRLPSIIRRFDKAPFGYRPGEPFGEFALAFDHAPNSGRDDKFEIAGSAYRLRKSQCFIGSKGEMTCQTCHDPHDVKRGAEAIAYYARKCTQCHSPTQLATVRQHPIRKDCTTCHMPKRRTEDAVHVVMTDHLIQRSPPTRDLLAMIEESHPAPGAEYRGEVVAHYPSPLPNTAVNRLYTAVAQVQHGTNLAQGILHLDAELARHPIQNSDFYMALGDAYSRNGQSALAVAVYQKAVNLRPNSGRELRFLGVALRASGQISRAVEVLKRAAKLAPKDPQPVFELALLASAQGSPKEAVEQLRRAAALDPRLPDVQNSLAVNLATLGDHVAAVAAFREAIRLDPAFATAHANFARLLAMSGDLTQAIYHYVKAVRLQPAFAPVLYEYGLTLARMNRVEEAEQQVRLALNAAPQFAEAHAFLGGLLARKRDVDGALAEFETAVRLKPEFSRAQLDLGATLAAKGSMERAKQHLRKAASSSDPQVAKQASQVLANIEARN
jgi:tetratricopeptide (TPR) repeat protein